MAKDIDECLAVLRAAANRLAPDAEARETFRKQESALREVASRAEVQSDPAIRSTAAYFQQKTIELRALSRSVEETRIELTTQIDRLEAQLRFNAGAGQMSELVRGGRNILTGIQAIAANAQQLANDLAGPHGTPAAAAQPAGTTRTPSAVAKPAATNPAHR
jgi:septal ring-binding cell division protein DamX